MSIQLLPEDVDLIVVHCTAGNADATREDIRDHALRNGWRDIPYEFLVHPDGRLSGGRPTWQWSGAQKGFNDRAIAVALVGHYDEGHDPVTAPMVDKLVEIVHALCVTYKVPAELDVENQRGVAGHRELYDLQGKRRLKTCPGTAIDMDDVRARVAARMGTAPIAST